MRDDTKHLLSSPKNAERLRKAIADMNALWGSAVDEPIPADLQELLGKLK